MEPEGEEGDSEGFHQLSRDMEDLGNTVVFPADDISVENAVLCGEVTGLRRENGGNASVVRLS